MNRTQLEHIIRAACGNADTDEVVIIGSQAILGAFPDAPEDLLASMEADVFPLRNPDDAILIDGAIGEKSIFHETFGYYAHGVGPDTAVLPSGWRDRLVPIRNENTRQATGWCLDPHDLAVSKLVAGREKDLEWLVSLLRNRLVDPDVLELRARDPGLFPDEPARGLALARLGRIRRAALG